MSTDRRYIFFLDIVKFIIEQLSTLEESEKLALINTKNEEGNTPLHWAALNGNYEVVEALVTNGGDCKVKGIFFAGFFFFTNRDN